MQMLSHLKGPDSFQRARQTLEHSEIVPSWPKRTSPSMGQYAFRPFILFSGQGRKIWLVMGLEKDHCVICVCPCHCALQEQIFPKILSTFSDFYGLLVFIMIVATCNSSCNIQQCFLYQSFYCCRKFQICFHDQCASGALCAFGQHQFTMLIIPLHTYLRQKYICA